MSTRRFASALGGVLALAATLAIGAARGPAPVPGLDVMTARTLQADLTFIASDAMEGRATPSRGLDITALFLATRLERWAVKPAGDDGTYFQRIALLQHRIDPERTTAQLGDRNFTFGEDFLASATPGSASGPLVYAGHGYVLKAKKIDAYGGLDVKGKILIVGSRRPEAITRADQRGRQGVDWDDPAGYAARQGAVGIVYLPSDETLASWQQSRANQVERGTTVVEKLEDDSTDRRVPSITASPALVSALFADESLKPQEALAGAIADKPAAPFSLSAGKVLKFSVAVKSDRVFTQNVVGVVEGADPKLKQEYVALGAHYDHVGTRPGHGDTIFNGADDDGSGTAAVLGIAEAFAKTEPRPRRSILLVWHAGEERGLWGSRYFTRFPTVKLNRVVAQLNIDMIGRSRPPGDTAPANRNLTGPNAIYVIGSTMMSSTLGRVTREVNDTLYKLAFDFKYDAPSDPERLFYRSDHYNYAKQGIPIIFYFDGVHEDYHRAGDSVDKIDFRKMEKVARTIYATARAIASLPERPSVDKRLPKQVTEP